jgi:hypothetical protein
MPADLPGRRGGHAIKKLITIIVLAMATVASCLQVYLIETPVYDIDFKIRVTIKPNGPQIDVIRIEDIGIQFSGERVVYGVYLR